MTMNNRLKTLARRHQAATGKPYATCLTTVREWDENGYQGWDEAAHQVALAELLDLTKKAASTLPAGSVEVEWDAHGGHPGAGPLVAVTTPGTAAVVEIDTFEGVLGFTWRDGDDEMQTAANFLDAEGHDLTDTKMLASYAADLPRVYSGIVWLLAQFAAHPEHYDDTDRPAVMQASVL